MKNENTTNALVYRVSKTMNGETIYLTIRLDENCKNGYEYFSITSDIYQAGKPKIDRYMLGGGCNHDDILKFYPEFAPFVALHLADFKGIPSHSIANSFYHLKEGFNRTPVDSPEFAKKWCEYYRIDSELYGALSGLHSRDYYAFLLGKMGVFAEWEKQSNEAIEILEGLTGKTFKSKYHFSKNAPIIDPEIVEKVNNGYFTAKAEGERVIQQAKDDKKKAIKEVREEANKAINKAKKDRDVKLFVLSKGLSIENFIYYDHTDKGVFNWLDFKNKITPEQLEKFKSYKNNLNGTTFEIKTGK